MCRYLICTCCLLPWALTGCGQNQPDDAAVGNAPHNITADSSVSDSQDVNSKPCCTYEALAEIDQTLLTETELEERYMATDPDNPRFYPGKAHPLGYATWHLQRPEGELTHKLSDRFSNIELTTADGEKMRFYDDLVKDRIVVVSFFYTRCNGICAPTNRSLIQVRRALGKSLGRDVRLISISLDTEHDDPRQLKSYARRYKNPADETDPSLPEWFFLCGDSEEVETLRREMGVYDLDPVIDADVTQHAGLLTYGNDRTNRWSALPSMLKPADLTEGILRIAGNRFRDPKYEPSEITTPDTWKIQGPLLELQPWHREVSIMDLKVSIPKTLPILGTDGITGRNLIDLVDSPIAEGVRLLTPCSLQTAGIVTASGGTDNNGHLIAEHCYVELAQHVTAGTLEFDENNQPMINGVPIRENPDLRFPMRIVDVTGETLTGQRLKSSVGQPATAEGYFHRGTLYTVLLQIAAMPQLTHRDAAVQIHNACGRSRMKQLRVLGTTNLTWVDSDVQIIDSSTGRVLGTKRVRKRDGQAYGYFVVDIDDLQIKPRFVFARIDGDSETVRSSNTLIENHTVSLLPSPAEFILQGPVTHLDPAQQTITVNGVTVQIPAELPIGGTNNITGMTLERLIDPQTTGVVRSLTATGYNSGYPVRICGQVSRHQISDPIDSTPVYTASSCDIDTQEVILTGILESIDPEVRQITVNGLDISLNSDLRFGFTFQDTAGNELSAENVSARSDTLIGGRVTVKGYSHLFQAKAVGTEYRPVQSKLVAVTVELSSQDAADTQTQSVDRRSMPPNTDKVSETPAPATPLGQDNA